ncbi:DUF3131 domain-containing protein [Anaeromyxobacter sp. SG66]|uniref:DUF3131 domain-containing protein n=1 Tax=Anaeromyxobacter sp. SG66 TaxID=2925410 RepID=UPI001F5A492A|nr:DUF3131 domain-containing protein [Anaeromyxobacter sp. SG66]
MSFWGGLLTARSHLAFLVGLAAAIFTVHYAGKLARAESGPAPGLAALASDEALALRRPAPLDADERRMARAAWSYFERNTDAATGLAGSVEGYPSTTMWDTGSQLMAILAAEDLGVISTDAAALRLRRALKSLRAIPLFDRKLPNKAYDTRTLEMVGYDNRPAPNGIGWSALDVARVLVPLWIVTWRHPELTPLVRRAVSRWRLGALSDGGALVGAQRRTDGAVERYQEGRFGYEQYAAKALLPWGVPVARAIDYRAHLAFSEVLGQRIPHDDRHPRRYGGTHAAVISEPWILDALEHGFDATTLPIARALVRVQERRFATTGKLTAISEDALDRAPWFAYSAVLNGDERWTAFAPDGTPVPQDLGFSTKAAVGWGVLFDGEYPDRLAAAARALVDARGLYAGRYDQDGAVNRALSLNTNALVLEALAYRARGPWLRPEEPEAPEARR